MDKINTFKKGQKKPNVVLGIKTFNVCCICFFVHYELLLLSSYLLFVNITIISKILTNLKTDAFEVIASRLLFFKL